MPKVAGCDASSAQPAVSTPQQTRRRNEETVSKLDKEYIASLRRSIKQMKDGDVQPVRAGLDELRRELDADGQVNSLDA